MGVTKVDIPCASADTAEPMANQIRAMSPVSVTERDRPARGNVIPPRRADDGQTSDRAPKLTLAEGGRPAPRGYTERRQLGLIILFSLLVHTALFAIFQTAPERMASVGEEAITVEIVVGANATAGIADASRDVELERQTAADTREEQATPEQPVKEDTARQSETAIASTEELVTPVEKEAVPVERNVEETPPEPKASESSRPKPTPSIASAPANSIGRGRMAGDANYQGLVAARLARFKRFPPEARRRREHGSAIVSFTIDGAGHVTSVQLVRGTGFAALDHEVQAMVKRASPFPPPPRGAEMSFSAPVNFHLN